MQQIELNDLYTKCLKSPTLCGSDGVLECWPLISKIEPSDIFFGNTIFHIIAKWNSMDWFYFETGANRATSVKFQFERWLTSLYFLDAEFIPNNHGSTAYGLAVNSANHEEYNYFLDWLHSRRNEIERKNLHKNYSNFHNPLHATAL